MNRRILWGTLTVALLIVWAAPAEAGQRHQQCRTCSTSGGGGNWFHFTSGGGTYVPFASKTSSMPVTSYSTYSSPTSAMTYGAGHSKPRRYSSSSSCYHCR